MCIEKTENKEKEAGDGPFFKKIHRYALPLTTDNNISVNSQVFLLAFCHKLTKTAGFSGI